MKKLIEQILKFGVVGIIAFVIDYCITIGCKTLFVGPCIELFGTGEPAIYFSNTCGFVISVTFNYLASMKYVFERREDTSRKREFIVFFSLSVVGLIINLIVLYLCLAFIKAFIPALYTYGDGFFANSFGKVAATAVVMVYNFITRKIFLEKRD